LNRKTRQRKPNTKDKKSMNLIEGFWAAMVAIAANKLRSLLTVLGIVIGVSAVLGMMVVVTSLTRASLSGHQIPMV